MDGYDQLEKMLEDPKYVRGMNILRDSRLTPFPEEFNFKYFKYEHPALMVEVERQLGNFKTAIVVDTVRDYTTAHQLSISTRLTPASITRKPFRNIIKARAWLDIPEGYEIIYPTSE